MLRPPFFILGNPRSGTTLIRLMLDAHGQIVVPPECGFMIWFYNDYKDWNTEGNLEIEITRFLNDLKKAKKIESWNLDFEELYNSLTLSKPKNYSELISFVYQFYNKSSQSCKEIKIWGDKNNFYIYHIEDIVRIFPNSKFVHIIRDGRDVACSYKELYHKKIKSIYAPVLSNDIKSIAKEWIVNNEKIIRDLNNFVDRENYTEIRYEDLASSPEKFLNKITKFLELDYDPKMLLYYKESKTYEPKEFLEWKENTKKAPQTSSIKRYIKELSKEEITIFNDGAKVLLKRYGYEI